MLESKKRAYLFRHAKKALDEKQKRADIDDVYEVTGFLKNFDCLYLCNGSKAVSETKTSSSLVMNACSSDVTATTTTKAAVCGSALEERDDEPKTPMKVMDALAQPTKKLAGLDVGYSEVATLRSKATKTRSAFGTRTEPRFSLPSMEPVGFGESGVGDGSVTVMTDNTTLPSANLRHRTMGGMDVMEEHRDANRHQFDAQGRWWELNPAPVGCFVPNTSIQRIPFKQPKVRAPMKPILESRDQEQIFTVPLGLDLSGRPPNKQQVRHLHRSVVTASTRSNNSRALPRGKKEMFRNSDSVDAMMMPVTKNGSIRKKSVPKSKSRNKDGVRQVGSRR